VSTTRTKKKTVMALRNCRRLGAVDARGCSKFDRRRKDSDGCRRCRILLMVRMVMMGFDGV